PISLASTALQLTASVPDWPLSRRLDGEVVASDADVRPNFARLHVRLTRLGTILQSQVTAAVNIPLPPQPLALHGSAHLIEASGPIPKLAQPLYMLFNSERYRCRRIACNFRL